MVFCGIIATEQIDLHPNDNLDKLHSIGITMDKHEPKFYIWSSDDREWFWEFWYLSRTDYERVKQCIIDVAYECDNINETLNTLNEVFLEYFSDMLTTEEDVCQCENISYSSYLN